MFRVLFVLGLLAGGCATAPTCVGLACNCPNATSCDYSAQTTCVNSTNNCMFLCGTGSVCTNGQCADLCTASCAAGSTCNFVASDASTLDCNHANCTLSGGASSKALCTGNSTCTLTVGENSTVTCDTSTSCGVHVGAGTMITCATDSTCDVTCDGACTATCTGAKCTLHCGSAAAQTVDDTMGSCS